MKKIIVVTFVLSFFQAFASDELRPERDPFQVLKDTFDAKIPKGKCLIEGTIYDNYSGKKLGNVSVLSGSKTVVSDKMGYFRVTQSTSITHLKFSKSGYTACYLEDYTFKDQHRIVIRVYIKNASEPIHYEVKKPVIYCYSDKDVDFEFSLLPKGKLFFSYPPVFEHELMANNTSKKSYEWSISLKNNILTDLRSDSIYPYLFWESVQNDVHYKVQTHQSWLNQYLVSTTHYQGTVIAKNELLNYLDTTLTKIGLNSSEKTDFMTFWAPQMMKKDYYLIQFLQDEECEQFATYTIAPNPTKVNRLYMLYAGFDKLPNIVWKTQNLKKMDRKGFYLVDWGGVEVPIVEFNRGGFYDEPINEIIKN